MEKEQKTTCMYSLSPSRVLHYMIKHNGHLRIQGKCRKHEPLTSVFYISQVFSSVRSVFTQCNTWLRFLHLLFDKKFTYCKKKQQSRQIDKLIQLLLINTCGIQVPHALSSQLSTASLKTT